MRHHESRFRHFRYLKEVCRTDESRRWHCAGVPIRLQMPASLDPVHPHASPIATCRKRSVPDAPEQIPCVGLHLAWRLSRATMTIRHRAGRTVSIVPDGRGGTAEPGHDYRHRQRDRDRAVPGQHRVRSVRRRHGFDYCRTFPRRWRRRRGSDHALCLQWTHDRAWIFRSPHVRVRDAEFDVQHRLHVRLTADTYPSRHGVSQRAYAPQSTRAKSGVR